MDITRLVNKEKYAVLEDKVRENKNLQSSLDKVDRIIKYLADNQFGLVLREMGSGIYNNRNFFRAVNRDIKSIINLEVLIEEKGKIENEMADLEKAKQELEMPKEQVENLNTLIKELGDI